MNSKPIRKDQGRGTLKVCSRGHTFFKSSDCPVCPVCWPGHYKKLKSDFPDKLAAPALRALYNAKITKLAQVSNYTESELLELHGIGPNAFQQLSTALKEKGLSFASNIRKRK